MPDEKKSPEAEVDKGGPRADEVLIPKTDPEEEALTEESEESEKSTTE